LDTLGRPERVMTYRDFLMLMLSGLLEICGKPPSNLELFIYPILQLSENKYKF
jgi:hypothetical protein